MVHVQGLLEISDNAYLVGLNFLSSLQYARAITIVDNPVLVDASLPKLQGNVPILIQTSPLLCLASTPSVDSIKIVPYSPSPPFAPCGTSQ